MTVKHGVAVIGSGPSAVGAIAALIERGIRPVVVDVGIDAERESYALQEERRQDRPAKPHRAELYGERGLDSVGQKLWFGSRVSYEQPLMSTIDYSKELTARASFGLGGFSRVWGATFRFGSPYSSSGCTNQLQELDVRAITNLVRHSKTVFADYPGRGHGGIESAEISQKIYRRLDRSKPNDILLEPSTVAIDTTGSSSSCVQCGACLTGCPTESIWFAGNQIRKWRDQHLIDYLPEVHIEKFIENSEHVSLYGTRNDSPFKVDAQSVFVATGPISTAAILIRSKISDRYVVRDSATSFGGAIGVVRGRNLAPHGLSQFWLTVANKFVAQVYPPSTAHVQRALDRYRLPRFMSRPMSVLLEHVHPLITYLPMQDSGSLEVRRNGERVNVSAIENPQTREAFTDAFQRLRRLFLNAGLYIPIGSFEIGAPGSGFHIGASLPHGTLTDELGRPHGLVRVHIVDGSVLPQLPLGSITPTIMANAHRIARTSSLVN